MPRPGFGAMIFALSGGSDQNAEKFYGRRIDDVLFINGIGNSRISLSFSDGSRIGICDQGQSCFEARYFTCDDDWNTLIGHELVRIETAEVWGVDDGGYGADAHEETVLKIETDDGFITIVAHNEHNGYYGGICLDIVLEQAGPADFAPPADF